MKPEDLTAWALDELSAEERKQIEAALETDPGAKAEAEATQSFCNLLTRELRDEEAALTSEQRHKLTNSNNPPSARPWIVRAAAPLGLAACIALAGLAAWRTPQQQSDDDLSLATSAIPPEPMKAPVPPATSSPPAPLPSIQTELAVAESAAQLDDFDNAQVHFEQVLAQDPVNSAARRGMERAEADREVYLAEAKDHTRAKMLSQVDQGWETPVPASPSPAASLSVRMQSSDAPYAPPEIPQSFGKPANIALQTTLVEHEDHLRTATFMAEEKPSSESYTPTPESPLHDVARDPLSTFSIDVDTASYANVRRFLNRNTLPPADAVRLEEMLNYFPYPLEGPAPDSPHPFAVETELSDCPWAPEHRLARIAIQARRLGTERPNSHLVFLLDTSGSMNEPDKLPLVQESLRLLVQQLGEKDRVSIVTYAGSSGLVLPPTNGVEKQALLRAIDDLKPGGSTHGSAGIELAYQQAVAGFIEGGVNRVILCTDGDFNVGISDPDQLHDLIATKAQSGVFLSVLGFGTGNLKDQTMETLADRGNGNYGYIDSLSEARKLLVEQMAGTLVTVAKDVKIQVEFNPAEVSHYRLLGYANRLLAKEDFNDDTKDAGEIGAGHAVTALYEIVPAGVQPAAPAVDALKYQPASKSVAPTQPDRDFSGELMTVKLRYKAPDGQTSQLIEQPVTDSGHTLAGSSQTQRFAVAVAGLALRLRGESHAPSFSWDAIDQLARQAQGEDAFGYRREFLQLLDKARVLSRADDTLR
ncbi:MAG: von Willebrand factor type A domain-containing protein [Verrucomicrobiales bacterium]|nr:von Willebrand factor type A domain-containing protein [Verrucomicrobiales bacterium]